MRMRFLVCGAFLTAAAVYGQAVQFEVASIHPSAPSTGHFPAPAIAKGGPGTGDPTMFRCVNCGLSFLITKAFALEKYQFPGQSGLPSTSFDVSARIPVGTSQPQFEQMLQSFLVERFGLSYHFDEKQLQGYELVVAKNGSKLTEAKPREAKPAASEGASHEAAAGGWHGAGSSGGEQHSRPGVMIFSGKAQYRGEGQTTKELAQMIATQLERPVDDKTGLTGKYDISLNWVDDGSHARSHAPLQATGGGGHGGSGDGSHGDAGGQSDPADGQTLLSALQTQLGLKVVEAKKSTARIFVVDRVAKTPTGN